MQILILALILIVPRCSSKVRSLTYLLRTAMKPMFIMAALSVTSPLLSFAATAYVPYARNASIPEVHNKPITASNGYFYVNRPTTAICPTYEPSCPSKNTTIISGPTYGSQWWMGILEDGGQELFVENLGLGRLGYAAADSDNYLPYYSSAGDVLRLLNSTLDGKPILSSRGGFSVCETDSDGSYSIQGMYETGGPNPGCQGIELVLEETMAPAVQYYACEGCESRCNSRYGCDTGTRK